MEDTMKKHVPCIATILISLIFVVGGIGKIMNFSGIQGYMENFGMPAAKFFLVVAIIIELVAGLMLIFKYRPACAAGMLIIYLIVVTLIFHREISDSQQLVQVLKNLAIIGGLLFIKFLNCPGRKSNCKSSGGGCGCGKKKSCTCGKKECPTCNSK